MSSIAEAAAHIDLSERRFQEMLAQGIFKRAARDAYNLNTIRVAYIRHLRDAAMGRADSSPTLTDARTRAALANAEAAELRNKVARGENVPLDVATEALGECVQVAREILLTLIGKIGDQLGRDAGQIAKVEVYAAMNSLSDHQGMFKRVKQLTTGKADDDEGDEE
jgi:phage terminase Nu1 subunit (DNA packaging protein)